MSTNAANPQEAEAKVRKALQGGLEDLGWSVTSEPVLGSVKPDFLVEDTRGNAYVIEVKRALRGAHFGSVAQTAAFREAANAEFRTNQIGAILVLAGTDAQELQPTGDDYGVQVVGTPSVEPHEMAQAIVDRLAVAADHRATA